MGVLQTSGKAATAEPVFFDTVSLFVTVMVTGSLLSGERPFYFVRGPVPTQQPSHLWDLRRRGLVP